MKERDSETGLDYFLARYYSSVQGRFLSPDEFAGGPDIVFGDGENAAGPLPYADITDPQSLNKYVYVYNRPLVYIDPDGHDPVAAALDWTVQSLTRQPPPPAQNQQDNRAGYQTQDQAARAALKNSNGRSIRSNREYAGLIYRSRDGRYHFTGPRPGNDQGSNPHDAKAPRGSRVVGDYHTHGDYSIMGPGGRAVRTHDSHRDDFNSDHFSGTDKLGIANDARGKPEYRGYLGTPSGKFLVYNPSEPLKERELK